jgi:hypothetical protein
LANEAVEDYIESEVCAELREYSEYDEVKKASD